MEPVVEELNLDFSKFQCCGDEDLYPFGCPDCGRIMVFCYECDTLYDDLDDLRSQGTQINNFDTASPIFRCPNCDRAFEYFFMRDGQFKVPISLWTREGFEHLLTKNERT